MDKTVEVQFDGLVGPTHHYAGLSLGNIASIEHSGVVSNPKAAALQGIKKAAALRDLGIAQAMLPPVRRPRLSLLRNLGFTGSDSEMIEKTYQKMPEVLSHCFSASSMWTANAATVSPSADTQDGKVHFTAANLSAKLHRSLESDVTSSYLKQIFNGNSFVHHEPIHYFFGDEGAANHGRLCKEHSKEGIEIFVFGKSVTQSDRYSIPKRFPARQALESSQAIALLHQVKNKEYVQQDPQVIDAGVFHNDVISVVNENVFFFYEKSFVNQTQFLEQLKKQSQKLWKNEKILFLIQVDQKRVSLEDVVKSYLFNSQLITLPGGEMALVCPQECQEIQSVWKEIQKVLEGGSPIKKVYPFDLKQSMQNGGGPACLRLRVVLTSQQRAEVLPTVWLTQHQERELTQWVQKYYRDRLSFEDLKDPLFLKEVNEAYDALEHLFQMSL